MLKDKEKKASQEYGFLISIISNKQKLSYQPRIFKNLEVLQQETEVFFIIIKTSESTDFTNGYKLIIKFIVTHFAMLIVEHNL